MGKEHSLYVAIFPKSLSVGKFTHSVKFCSSIKILKIKLRKKGADAKMEDFELVSYMNNF